MRAEWMEESVEDLVNTENKIKSSITANQIHSEMDPSWVLEVSPRERGWMDSTPNKFAYRCLPMLMANQAGFIIRNPVGFTVFLTAKEADGSELDIRFDEREEYWKNSIKYHFGGGILTFCVPWLFKTAPGMALRVSGMPNQWKFGAHALEGLVESAWLDFTFTMNWQIFIYDHGIRFDKGEPICFIQPVYLDNLDGKEMSIKLLKDDIELNKRYVEMSTSRFDFLKDPERGDKWQKHYFQGKTLAGEAVQSHKTKINLKVIDRRI